MKRDLALFGDSDRKITLIREAAAGRKAEEIVVLEMARLTGLCDYFVIMSAPSAARVKAIVDAVEEVMEREGLRARHREGYETARWVLLDYGTVVAHVFYHETRRFYDLENLWGDAPRRVYSK